MKQLKFMIAATAAIGLAGVAQAAFPSTTELDAAGNTGFEEYADGAAVTTGTLGKKFENGEKTNTDEAESFFWYTGDVAADNESKIKAGSSGLPAKAPRAKGDKFNADDNVLEVNTGTDPLLRTINRVVTNEGVSSAEPVTVPAETGIYIDTLVQFTVTPAGDTVTPKAGDKLMIYLQEVLDNTETTDVDEAATNLVVVAGRSDDGQALVRETYTVNNVAVEPNKWYRLRVKAFDSVYTDSSAVLPAFTIEVDGTVCTFDKPSCGQTALAMILGAGKAEIQTILAGGQSLVFSLIAEKTLKAVGFAGEGKVDDIVFSTTLDPIVDAIDFTLSVVGASAVKAVIGENNEVEWAQGKFVLPAGTKTFTIEYTPATAEALWNPTYAAALSEASNCTFDGLTVTLGSGAPSAKLTVTATEGTSAPTVGENATADSVGITIGAFSGDTGAALQKVVNWAVKAGLTKAELNNMPPFEANTGNATNEMQEAFLLNCAVSDLATAKAAFKFPAIVPGQVPAVYQPTDGYNGTLNVWGADTVEGLKDETSATADHKFFKAVLTK